MVWDGVRRGVERRNDGNHFWLGALGVLELGIRKTNQERRTMDGVGRGEVEWRGRLWWIGEDRFKRLSQLIILELI